MKNDNESKCGESISILNREQEISETQSSSDKIIVTTTIESKSQFNCIHIYKNTVYLGTKNARLFIFNISLPSTNPTSSESQDENQDFILKEQKMITPHSQIISLIKADDRFFVTVPQTDGDSFVSIWSATSKQFLTAIKAHNSQVSQIVFMKHKKYIATSSWDCTVRIWSLEDFQRQDAIKTFKGNYPILDLKEFNQQILVFGGDDCYLLFWNWKKNQIVKKQFGHAGSVTYIQIMQKKLFTAGGDNKFKFWQVNTVQSTQKSGSENGIDFKSKYQIKKIQQHKEEYDSIMFGTFYQNYILLIDRQGELFLFVNEKIFYRLTNFFEYNESITGIDVFGDFVLITTTKGCLKHFNIRNEIGKLKLNLSQQNIIVSETKVLKVDTSNSQRNIDIKQDELKAEDRLNEHPR